MCIYLYISVLYPKFLLGVLVHISNVYFSKSEELKGPPVIVGSYSRKIFTIWSI